MHDWLPYVLNEVEPWMSSEDIKKGTRWASELAITLTKTDYAILFVTPENQFAQWLLFEAGALSTSLGAAVATVLIDLDSDDLINGPLGQFQATKISRDDMRRLVEAMNSKLSRPHSDERLHRAFDMWWTSLEQKLGDAWDARSEQTGVATPNVQLHLDILKDDNSGRAFRLRFPQWLEELARAIKSPPRSVSMRFSVTEEAVQEIEKRLATRSCPAHPRFIRILKVDSSDGRVTIEATACCRFALLIARDYVRDIVF